MAKKRSTFGLEQKLGMSCTVVVVLLVLLTVVIKATGGINWEFSSGTRSGVVQKISKKGVFWKTWEGELNLGYNQSSTNENGQQTIAPAMFYFSVEDDDVAGVVGEAETSGKRVTVEYKQYFLRGWDKGRTSYDVTGIKERLGD